MHETRFVKNTACHRCREAGRDRHGDNMAIYSDDSSHCWSCGFFDLGKSSVNRFLANRTSEIPAAYIGVNLPADSDMNYSQQALDWFYQYDLNKRDLLTNGILWSDRESRLLFPYWRDAKLLGWQGRYFGVDSTKKKWYTRGKLERVAHVLSKGMVFAGKSLTNSSISEMVGHDMNDATRLVITEDVVSAIKVSKCGVHAMPIFGTNIKSRWPQIRSLNYQTVILWLDPNMAFKMVKEGRVGRLQGVETRLILSLRDPKQHSYEEIREFLQN